MGTTEIVLAILALLEKLGPEAIKIVSAWQKSGATVDDFRKSLKDGSTLDAELDAIIDLRTTDPKP